MAVDSQLTLFGLDLRRIPEFWRAGWNEMLWAPNAYCRRWVDEVVTATYSNEGCRSFLAGKEVSLAKTKAQAYILPEALVLDTRLALPASVELDLESLLALEVRSKSPFPEEDTRYGWQVERLKSGDLQVDLAIVSHPLVMQHLQDRETGVFDSEDRWLREQTLEIDEDERSWLRGKQDEEEVWAIVDEQPIIIQGYGEAIRDKRYNKRMKRVLAGLFYSFLMLCALVAVMMVFKYWQMQEFEVDYEQIRIDSTEAVELRSTLAEYNARVSGLNGLIARSYNPYPQISKLSEILADDTWLASMNIKKNTMRLDGRSENAATLMTSLSNRPEFSEVVATSAITRTRGQGERFVFDISLDPIEVGEVEAIIEIKAPELTDVAVGEDDDIESEAYMGTESDVSESLDIPEAAEKPMIEVPAKGNDK